jgi:hypothetical protein
MCGTARITARVLACQTCWFSLPQAAQIAIMAKPRGNVRARAFYTYLHEHGLSRLSPPAGGGQ